MRRTARYGATTRSSPQAVVVATGITEDGNRQVLGVMVGDNETDVFRSQFLRSLWARNLSGVRLVIAPCRTGRRDPRDHARCRLPAVRGSFPAEHLQRVLERIQEDVVAATIRTIFAQPDAVAVRRQLDEVAGMLGRQFPKTASGNIGTADIGENDHGQGVRALTRFS
ncbi:transposase [Streptomyces anthocyanicus]|uniref:transposase n=1 Tax=Streptomyces anthocyanicus TaxID=68174 RepID=UPI0038678444